MNLLLKVYLGFQLGGCVKRWHFNDRPGPFDIFLVKWLVQQKFLLSMCLVWEPIARVLWLWSRGAIVFDSLTELHWLGNMVRKWYCLDGVECQAESAIYAISGKWCGTRCRLLFCTSPFWRLLGNWSKEKAPVPTISLSSGFGEGLWGFTSVDISVVEVGGHMNNPWTSMKLCGEDSRPVYAKCRMLLRLEHRWRFAEQKKKVSETIVTMVL